jgi:hypothetical protein
MYYIDAYHIYIGCLLSDAGFVPVELAERCSSIVFNCNICQDIITFAPYNVAKSMPVYDDMTDFPAEKHINVCGVYHMM